MNIFAAYPACLRQKAEYYSLLLAEANSDRCDRTGSTVVVADQVTVLNKTVLRRNAVPHTKITVLG